ncbi:MAG: hypothetical protein ACTTJH_05600, partial [Bacteroidales bacterium]
ARKSLAIFFYALLQNPFLFFSVYNYYFVSATYLYKMYSLTKKAVQQKLRVTTISIALSSSRLLIESLYMPTVIE